MTSVDRLGSERGASALLAAGSLMFLLGAAVMAVDVSGFFNDARTHQTTADLSCLAGARELPDVTAAISVAADYAETNWPDLGDGTLTYLSGDTATLTDGDGNTVIFEVNPDGMEGRMRVTATNLSDTSFAKVFGASDVTVSREAFCGRSATPGHGAVPFGALPAWDGVLQVDAPCDTGNCRALDLPRSDINGSGSQFIRNLALGAEVTLEPGVDVLCTPDTDVCDTLNMNQGVSAGQLADGLVREGAGVDGRLRDLTAADEEEYRFETQGNRTIDAMSPEDVFGASYATWNGESVDAHDPEIHGPLHNQMLYIDGPIAHCDSPRLIRVPIIAQVGWESGEEFDVPNGNSELVKVIGFYHAVIVDPDGADDFGKGSSDNLATASAVIWWPGPDAECMVDGEWVDWDEATTPAEAVKLLAG